MHKREEKEISFKGVYYRHPVSWLPYYGEDAIRVFDECGNEVVDGSLDDRVSEWERFMKDEAAPADDLRASDFYLPKRRARSGVWILGAMAAAHLAGKVLEWWMGGMQ